MILPKPIRPPVCGDAGGTRADGSFCHANLAPGATRCVHHDPAQAEEMAARRLRGNVSRSRLKTTERLATVHGTPGVPRNLEDATTFAAWAAHGVASGTVDTKVGHEIAFILNSFRGALEKRDLLREIEQLRRDLAAARKESPKAGSLRRG